MHRSTLTSRFLAGWEPAQLPPRGPDGMIPAPPPAKLPVIEPPSLCEAGPCRNFHRVQSLMDAQEAMDGTPSLHPQVTRACYPAPGIELELGETPVLRCSRWEPDNEQGRLDALRDAFLKSPNGKAFVAKVGAFEEALAVERAKRDALEDEDPSDELQAEADAAVDAVLANKQPPAGGPSDDILDEMIEADHDGTVQL